MSIRDDIIVTVVRHPFEPGSLHKKGNVMFGDIKNTIHWSNNFKLEGEYGRERDELLPNYYLCCQFHCDKIIGEYLAHSCNHKNRPHYIYSFILKSDNIDIYDELVKIAGNKPKIERATRVSHKLLEQCAEEIVDALINRKEHKALKNNRAGDKRVVIRANLFPVQKSNGTENTKANIGRRINKIIREKIKKYPDIKETIFGGKLAFEVKNN